MSPASKGTSKKSAAKPAAAHQKSTTGKFTASGERGGTGMDRDEMIAVAAYYCAERRGFNGGDPVVDWLTAEAEIDAMLKNSEVFNVH